MIFGNSAIEARTNYCLLITVCCAVLLSSCIATAQQPTITSRTQNPQTTTTQTQDAANVQTELATLKKLVEQQRKDLAQLHATQKSLQNQIDQLMADKVDRFSLGPVRKLFDGTSLKGWEATSYGGEGECEVVDGAIQMAEGDPVTGINVTDDVELPRHNYEISFNAMKIEGTDFFGSVTFPVNDTYCTFIVGGWAGTLVGLSNLDGKDASENGTRVLKKFERNQWYHIRVRVLKDRITAWIDGEKMVDESIVGREVSIRGDVTPSQPLGITSFITVAAIKDIELREFTVGSKN